MTNIAVPTPAHTVPVPASSVIVPAGSVQVPDTQLLALMPPADIVSYLESLGYTVTSPTPTSKYLNGSYNGWGNAAGVAAHGTATGETMTLSSDYLSDNTWATITGGMSQWAKGTKVALGVPAFPQNFSGSAALASGAAGAFNAYWTTFGQNLVAQGLANAILRFAWEWDGSWTRWYAGNATDAANLAAYFRQFVNTLRAVPGQAFTFSWYYGQNGQSANAYPGNTYVDDIQIDFYDQSWWSGTGAPPYNGSAFTQAQHQAVWAGDQLPRLKTFAAFAAARGKPVSFGEWGVVTRTDGHGGGDDPWFIPDFVAWVKANNVAWLSYFDFNDGSDDSQLSTHPLATAALKSANL